MPPVKLESYRQDIADAVDAKGWGFERFLKEAGITDTQFEMTMDGSIRRCQFSKIKEKIERTLEITLD